MENADAVVGFVVVFAAWAIGYFFGRRRGRSDANVRWHDHVYKEPPNTTR